MRLSISIRRNRRLSTAGKTADRMEALKSVLRARIWWLSQAVQFQASFVNSFLKKEE